MNHSSRRRFLRNMGSALSAATILPLVAQASGHPAGLPPFTADEDYWQLVKDQFSIRPGYIMMNAANLCPAPRAVSQSVNEAMKSLDQDVSFQHRGQFGLQFQEAVDRLAVFLGTTGDQLTITRNTSESNNIVVNGLDLGRGDEVVVWDQNHPSNNLAWKERARRLGFTVKEVKVPADPGSREELIEPFVAAFSSRTRLVSFSHISNVSGIRMPAEDLVKVAKSRGILTQIDGAQSFGSVRVELDKIGCDFYTGSTHKWFVGPREAGILFVRQEHIERIWPNIVTAGYDAEEQTDIQRLSNFGQRNPAVFPGILQALNLHSHISIDRVEERVYELAGSLREKISENVPDVQWVTPGNKEFNAGVLICNIPGKDFRSLFGQLYEQHKIAGAPTGGLRFCPHIYNTMDEVARVADAVKQVAGA